MSPHALLALLFVRAAGAALSLHRAPEESGDPAALPLELDADDAPDLEQATQDLAAAADLAMDAATDAIEETANATDATEETANATEEVAAAEPAGEADPAPEDAVSKKIKAQLWQALETLRDSRGSTGWQAPFTSYEIEPPTQEMHDMSTYGRAVKFFLTPAAIEAAGGVGGPKCGLGAAPFTKGRRINVSAGPLRRSKIWFLNTLNYTLREYLLDRAHCGHLNIAPSLEEADLCFPSCDANDSSTGLSLSFDMSPNGTAEAALSLAVPVHRRAVFEGCERIDVLLHPRHAGKTPCAMAVPALHGIARPPGVQEQDAPWNVVHQRESLLSYIGGTPKHATIMDDMAAYSRELDEQKPEHIFSAPVLHTAMDSRSIRELKVYQTLAWELYSSSEFAWQGATPSRRGFYDAWMVGAIPVVPMSAAYSYSAIMDGQPFRKMLRNLAVLIPENISHSGRDIIKHVQQISPKSILMRRRRIRQVAPFLQYGWNERADAFTASLGALMQRSAASSEAAKAWSKAALDRENAISRKGKGAKTPGAAPPKSPAAAPADQAGGTQADRRNGTAAEVKAKPAPGKTHVASRTSTTSTPAGKVHHKDGARVKSTTAAPAEDLAHGKQSHQARQGGTTAAPAESSAGARASVWQHTPGTRAIASASKPSATDTKGADSRAKASATITTSTPQAAKDPRNTSKLTKQSKPNDITANVYSVEGTTTPKVLDAASPGDANKVKAMAMPSTTARVSSVMVDLIPDDVTSPADHSRFMKVMAVCALVITLAGISLLTSPGLTESMRNPRHASAC